MEINKIGNREKFQVYKNNIFLIKTRNLKYYILSEFELK